MRTRFGIFLEEEMNRRKLSGRAFAKLLSVAPNTIRNYINGKDLVPSLEFLLKLSQVTGIDLVTLLALAFPDIKIEPDPEAVITAQRYLQMPEAVRDMIDRFVLSQEVIDIPNGDHK